MQYESILLVTFHMILCNLHPHPPHPPHPHPPQQPQQPLLVLPLLLVYRS